MKGVTEIHISCAFHEHNICDTEVLIIGNWNQPPGAILGQFFANYAPEIYSNYGYGCGCYGFYDGIIFEKLQTVQKLAMQAVFFIHFTRGEKKNLQKIKHSQNFEASVEAKNTKTKTISILPKSRKSIKKSLFGPKNAGYALKHLARYTPILCQI